ncbi:hypothetical protein HYV57_05070 [Candidatus Peregrinibacteria bacterium]|nr:hypothetical protein [Candidatus Peregrinibacteria bacterium]
MSTGAPSDSETTSGKDEGQTEKSSTAPLETDQNGILDFSPFRSEGLGNLYHQLPLAELLVDIRTFFPNAYSEDEFVIEDFSAALKTIADGQETNAHRNSPSELRLANHPFMKLLTHGRFGELKDNVPFCDHIIQAVDPNIFCLSDLEKNPSIATYLERALPMLKALNHSLAASTFRDGSYDQMMQYMTKIRNEIFETQQRLLLNRIATPKSKIPIKPLVLPVHSFTYIISRLLTSPPPVTSETQQRIQRLEERVQRLEQTDEQQRNRIYCFLPGCHDDNHDFYWWNTELIGPTLELLEDQVTFIELTTGLIDDRSKQDELAVVRETIAKKAGSLAKPQSPEGEEFAPKNGDSTR